MCPPLEMCPQKLDSHSADLLHRSSRNEPWVGLGWSPHSSPVLTPTAQSHRVPRSCSHCPITQSTPSVRTSAGTAAPPGFGSGASSLLLGRVALFKFGEMQRHDGDQELQDNRAGSRARPGLRVMGATAACRLNATRSPPASRTGKGPEVSRLPPTGACSGESVFFRMSRLYF